VRASSQVRRGGLGLFCASRTIIPGSGRGDPEKCDVMVLESDTRADPQISRSGVSDVPEADAQRVVIFLDRLVLKTSGGKPVFCKYVYCPRKNGLSLNPPVPRHPIFQPNHPLPGISAARNVGTCPIHRHTGRYSTESFVSKVVCL
jgi:hypothetical protein